MHVELDQRSIGYEHPLLQYRRQYQEVQDVHAIQRIVAQVYQYLLNAIAMMMVMMMNRYYDAEMMRYWW